jgi:hypothetical protein
MTDLAHARRAFNIAVDINAARWWGVSAEVRRRPPMLLAGMGLIG